jgi:hypothetical protein
MEHKLDATITVLLIFKISSTCFGQTFAHLLCAKQQRAETLPATSTGHYTICCKIISLALLKMGKSLPETCSADLGDQ